MLPNWPGITGFCQAVISPKTSRSTSSAHAVRCCSLRGMRLTDSTHSSRLGSCDKVIESTRTFADLQSYHYVKSGGIVDRDRRTAQEVEYLRRKHILVPEVAEIENLFLLEDVIKIMAARQGRNPDKVFG